ncbi:MAG TPA: MBL fold metallo-hydrolase [Azospirillaceae bacterium]|nr:MBL fold metallo-hydrolase [Azospirillaceae bacterium]
MAIQDPTLDHPFADIPHEGDVMPVAPGILWVRMPLPFALNHVNVWLLEDEGGWLAVDAGLNSNRTQEAWRRVFADGLGGRGLSRLLVTHFHPDHMGAAGWLAGMHGIELHASLAEWAFARMLLRETDEDARTLQRDFYGRCGLAPDLRDAISGRGNAYARGVSPIPPRFERLRHGDSFHVGGRKWRVITGSGHAPEMLCLYAEDGRVLIAADQILPSITPNVSVWPQEPNGDPLADFVASLERFADLPEDTLVLPSHGRPFRGLHPRRKALAAHHDDRLADALAACDHPRSVADIMGVLFRRDLDVHQSAFAVGETLAHLNRLVRRGDLVRVVDDADVWRFERRRS